MARCKQWKVWWMVALAACARGSDPGAVTDAGMDAAHLQDAAADAHTFDATADAGADSHVAWDADTSPDDAAGGCVYDFGCDDGNECTCNPRLPDGGCGMVVLPNCTHCSLGDCYGGICYAWNCDGLGDDCNVGVCVPDAPPFECLFEPKPDCTPCGDGAGVCSAGECVSDSCPASCDPQDCPEG
jgi:hypothetical protein